MENQLPKFNIEKDQQELKLFMFCIQSGPVKIDLPEDFKAIIAYTDIDAMNQVLKEYPIGVQLFIKKKAEVEIRKIVNMVYLETSQNVPVTIASPTPETEMTRESFTYGLMLVADRFVTNERDKASIKRILKKVNLHEDQTTPTSNKNIA